jgi:cytochrome c oxidase subunit III
MNSDESLLTVEQRDALAGTIFERHHPEEQYANPEQQHQTASLGMWVFLATEVMFFGVLFLSVYVYRLKFPLEFEKASEKLNWIIGGVNTLVLLLSSLTIVLAVHYARLAQRKRVVLFMGLTALLGILFLVFKAREYYLDYVENLIPGWRFVPQEWQERDGLSLDQVPHVKLFLFLYWVMTGVHALHVTIGIVAVLVIRELAKRGHFTTEYYTPVDIVALYWHFVDIVWIFLLPTLYLLGVHQWPRGP